MRGAPVLAENLQRSDMRALAYAMKTDRFLHSASLYEAGAPAAALYLILDGSCKACTTFQRC